MLSVPLNTRQKRADCILRGSRGCMQNPPPLPAPAGRQRLPGCSQRLQQRHCSCGDSTPVVRGPGRAGPPQETLLAAEGPSLLRRHGHAVKELSPAHSIHQRPSHSSVGARAAGMTHWAQQCLRVEDWGPGSERDQPGEGSEPADPEAKGQGSLTWECPGIPTMCRHNNQVQKQKNFIF